MSMLTPLGSGGRSRRQRRWPRILLVLVVLALVGGGAYAAWRWLTDDQADAPAASTPTPVCHTPTLTSPKALPDVAEVVVAVANGTDQAGLAVDTADALAAAGFDVSDIGNTSKPVKKGVAEVRYGPDALAEAITVAAYLPGAELVEVTRVQDADVEVWIGPEFTQVAASAQADPQDVVLPTLDPVCRTPKP